MAATIRVTEPALRVEHNYSVTVEFETVHDLKGPSALKNEERAAKVSKSRCRGAETERTFMERRPK